MEPLEKTEIPTSLLPPVETGRRLGRVLRERDFVVRALVAIILLVLIGMVVSGLLLLAWVRQGTVVIGLGPDGTTFVAKGKPMDAGDDLKKQAAKLAAQTLLSRGSQQKDFIEWLPLLFSADTQQLAEQLWGNEQAEFSQRQWEQKPRIFQIDLLEVKGSSVEVVMGGELTRSGPVAGQTTEHQVPFTLHLTLVRNRDLLRSARYPWLVVAFDLKYETAHP